MEQPAPGGSHAHAYAAYDALPGGRHVLRSIPACRMQGMQGSSGFLMDAPARSFKFFTRSRKRRNITSRFVEPRETMTLDSLDRLRER